MLIVTLLLVAPCGAPAPACSQEQERSAQVISVQRQRGKVHWFEGSFDELLAEAARSKRLIFVDFWSKWSPYSKKLEQVTFVHPKVVQELSEILCFAVDTDTKAGYELMKRYQVQTPPTLVFIDPEGTLRDQISGYASPEPFLMELDRIRRNEGTLSNLRARIHKDPGDLDARWELACKLKKIGDLPGHEEQVASIRDRDPGGKSLASRRMLLSQLASAAILNLDLTPLYGFVQGEQDPRLLFEGWWNIWDLEGQLARSARDPEKEHLHELRHFAAARALWPLVPVERTAWLGNNIAWSFYQHRDGAGAADLEFAVEVARKAVSAAPEVPAVVDTLACCLYASGKRDEAIETAKRCIELDPQNSEWRERLAGFLARRQ